MWCSLSRTVKSDAGEIVPVYRAGIEFEGVDTAGEPVQFIEENVLVKV